MKILVLSLYYEPDRCQSNGPIIRALCEDWAAAGHEVTVLASFPHYSCPAVWPAYRGRLLQFDRVGPVQVIRSYIYVPQTRSSLGRLLNYLSFNLSSLLAGLLSGRQDVIFAMSPPLTIGLTAWLLGLLKRAPFCYNLQDIWPEAAVRLGMLRNRRMITLFEWLERFIYRQSQRIFAISEDFRTNLHCKGVTPGKIVVLPNFVDTDRLQPSPRHNEFAVRHGLTDRFVVLYAGNLGLSQGLEVILEAAQELKSATPRGSELEKILFLIVGQGSCRDQLIEEAIRRRLTNVRFLPLQPEDDLPLLYGAADLALIPLRKGITENSVPCKTYAIMASGKPYLAGVDPGSNVWKLTEEVECGWTIPPEDGTALAAKVRELAGQADELVRRGRRGRAHAELHYSRPAITSAYRQELEEMVATAEAHP
jgi:colanic acid biosynthesis glycosyl transferase WcaI